MRLKKLIKSFIFENNNRDKIDLTGGLRLHPTENALMLPDDNGLYSLNTDLYAITWAANPNNVKQWLSFESIIEHVKIDGIQVTEANYRLGDGINEYYWNGANWEINNIDWNTESEISNNINLFSVTTKKIQIIINLLSTNQNFTPKIKKIKILYSSDIEFQSDIIYRSLIPTLRDNIRPISNYPIRINNTTTTIDLINNYPLQTPYNIIDIDSVFNHTTDPDHFNNILQSYDQNTKTITLSNQININEIAWINFIWEPEIAVTTGQEYYEIDKIPSIILTNLRFINKGQVGFDDYVLNKATGVGIKVPAPNFVDVNFTAKVLTDSARDQMILTEELKKFLDNNTLLTSKGLDEQYRLWIISEYDQQTEVSQSEIYSGKLRFSIVNVLFYLRDEVEIYAVKEFKLGGDMNTNIT